ncbi:MAG: hypothetical protein Q8R76_03835 [Candidatus Omnitrophota bacterium]|nr:hypothetical protein [Candidatus Omnitrophota bacterium]
MRNSYWLILLAPLWIATANIEMGQEPAIDYGGQFSELIKRASERLQKVAAARPLKLKGLNDSLANTSRATMAMATGGSEAEIWGLLDAARRDYGGNSFAILLQAVVKSARGDPEAANHYFEEFLLESRTFTDFEKTFLKWAEYHQVRRIVYQVLESRGVTFEGREEKIHFRVHLEELMRYVMNPGSEDKRMNVAFIAVLFGGLALFGVSWLLGVELPRSLGGSLAVLYLAVWVAYGVWILDLAFGLPYGLSRFKVIPIFLTSVFVMVIGIEMASLTQERRKVVADGYRLCPHCQEPLPELLVECLACRKPVPPVVRKRKKRTS